MKLQSDEKIFNLYDTNGRRKDILNAYKIYLTILNDININQVNPWAPYPKSLNQYKFYKRAVNDSIGTFNEHPQYDAFEDYLKSNPLFNKKFYKLDSSLDFNKVIYTNKKGKDYTIKAILDTAIESRARHYTSSLNNIGFVSNNRELTPSGKALISPSVINTDILEKNLNLSSDNLLTLRQILKVRIFDSKGERYYSPGKFALYLVLKQFSDRNIYSVSNFMKIVQLVSPTGKYTMNDIDNQLQKNGFEGLLSLLINNGNNKETEFIQNLGDKQIPKNEFYKLFTNRKSSITSDIYFDFYNSLCKFILDRNESNFIEIKELMKKSRNKEILKKAFGYGKKIFKISPKTSFRKFMFDNGNHEFLKCSSIREFNHTFYSFFTGSKSADRLKENKSETKYILEATGLFKTESGIMTIRNEDLFKNQKIIMSLRNDILNSGSFDDYESTPTSSFGQMKPLIEILGTTEKDVELQIDLVTKKYGLDKSTSLEQYLDNNRSQEFEDFVKNEFPKEKVFDILCLFKNRDNDAKIQKEVTNKADVPTIFEYVSGLAWYYLSDEHYCLLKTFRLTFDANFLPLTHASGGDGDLIVNYNDRVLMIEVTLMNKNAQKRGEWEPVLRHSVNLSINSDKPSTTLFLADKLDNNTINIWRAVASVPLESSNKVGSFTDTAVKIMPLQIDDFIAFSKDSGFSSKHLMNAIDKSYEPLAKKSFDNKWRNEIIESAIK
ncbi:AlwI family type II restriction endonuclease [Lactobacillus xylocopicola]|uniref:AlwI family type II restriction endonuclease n=1 Tax=Lactobacillus xylocopicola TaxID=2976676 RepID=A0ABN6SKL9_9LACO|nr:AlwI family type II restriction endonuclease [Lactobacillus xylocopicola]BDR60179.1 AlwI family type II restriction endonuclease [Lactobacillus xylocopicola]